MKRTLLRSRSFVRAARKRVKKDPSVADYIRDTLELLAEDAFDPQLKTHKLKGKLAGSWACSIGYDLRLVFKFVEYDETEAVLLETIGSHEEVY